MSNVFQMNLNQRTPLTREGIAARAPSVFATQPHHAVSEKYRFISTAEMVDTLAREGWECVQAGEHRVKSASKAGFQKHMLRFRNPNLPKIGDGEVDLVLFNSHDRTTGFQFRVGVFRQVCANGLVVSENLFKPISVRHVGYKAEDAIAASYRVIDAVPRVAATVEEMRAITLTPTEQMMFAESAIIARYGKPEEGQKPAFKASTALALRRDADRSQDLWTTFNRVQENLVRGGVGEWQVKQATGRYGRASMRAVTSISENVKLNAALWTLAEAMRDHKLGRVQTA